MSRPSRQKGLSLWERIALPPHSFQARTELILENVPLATGDTVLEIGVGPGYNAYCLGPLVRSWVGADISSELLELLPPAPRGDVRFELADATDPGFAARHRGRYTKVVSSDALHGIPDAPAFFRTIAEALAPEGEAFVTLPNNSRGGRTITAFPTVASLERVLAESGLEAIEIRTVETRPVVRGVKQLAIEAPARLLRALRARGKPGASAGSDEASRFDGSFFHRIQRIGTIPRLCMNTYMEVLVVACKVFGGTFYRLETSPEIDPSRLWMRLRRARSGDRMETGS